MQWPSKEQLTQIIVEKILGPNKTIDDLPNQWVMKHLVLGLREALYMLVVLLKTVYEQLTAVTATGEKLDELGDEYGVLRKSATKAIYSVSLGKSSPVPADLPVPDYFLVTTTPIGNDPPVQFRVMPGQNKKIPAGKNTVSGVLVECTTVGENGNVPSGAINLVAQAGFDFVSESVVIQAGTNIEDDDSYRKRILDRKKNPGRGGTADDYKAWAESVTGVVSALVIPLNRGNGTVDIVITGVNGIPEQALIETCQAFIDTKTPAGLAQGGVRVMAPSPVIVNVDLQGCVWAPGYSIETGTSIITRAVTDYIENKANVERIVRVLDIITVAKQAFNPSDPSKTPVLIDFQTVQPTTNYTLNSTEMAVVGTINIS
ncbi:MULTISPECIES: baseplate J/gp47 family protein [Brevibacillus]|uniref:baseplate J/gp47 family protein n=1 Tax=Brevibacillus TaxID=55080 RepID=UPI0004F36199|nr:baseplate J/gp47 family protein [Brevibacillus borstelensis]KKX52558.1 baseplate J family protein [Brevibacillus borstelensis cifa_chp40]